MTIVALTEKNLPRSWGVALSRGGDAASWALLLAMYWREGHGGTHRTKLRDMRRWYRLARAFTHESRLLCAVTAFEFWRTNHVPPTDKQILDAGWPAEALEGV